MKKIVWFGFLMVWLAGCRGTYKSLEGQYPLVSPMYSKLNFEIISPEGINKKELENFRELIILQLEKKGFVIVPDAERRLIVEIVKIDKESKADRATKWTVVLLTPYHASAPLLYTSSNALALKVSLKDQERTIEFEEFQEFHESTKNWDDMKIAIANRIADAVYFTAR